jgi:hypothetical protein
VTLKTVNEITQNKTTKNMTRKQERETLIPVSVEI